MECMQIAQLATIGLLLIGIGFAIGTFCMSFWESKKEDELTFPMKESPESIAKRWETRAHNERIEAEFLNSRPDMAKLARKYGSYGNYQGNEAND